VDGVFVFNSTDVVIFTDSDISKKFCRCRVGVFLNLFNHLVDFSSNFLLVVLKLRFLGPVVFEDKISADLDRITVFTDSSDFILRSVSSTRVGHRVTVISVGAHLNADRTVLKRVGSSPLDSFTNIKDILAFNLESRNFISSSIIVSVMRVTLVGGSHTIQVVFANVDHREFPESSHVLGFE
jgi:hypothetical protein